MFNTNEVRLTQELCKLMSSDRTIKKVTLSWSTVNTYDSESDRLEKVPNIIIERS